jgi:hypothetical protein
MKGMVLKTSNATDPTFKVVKPYLDTLLDGLKTASRNRNKCLRAGDLDGDAFWRDEHLRLKREYNKSSVLLFRKMAPQGVVDLAVDRWAKAAERLQAENEAGDYADPATQERLVIELLAAGDLLFPEIRRKAAAKKRRRL